MGTNDEPDSGRGKWLALAAALLGWLFDGAEMGVFSMVGRPAIKDLLATTDEGVIGLWFGVVTAGFLVGAATGGVLFGWLGDRLGRVRAMTLSVLTYSVFTGLCGVAGEAWQVGALRFIAALGMGGEWSLGVALVMEVWPNRSRAFMAGLIGAAANVGYMLVGFVGLGLAVVLGAFGRGLASAGLAQDTVDWLVRNQGWRLMMMVGTLPALLTFFIRLFVPESAKWQEEKGRGATSGWATRDLLGVVIGALGPALMVYLWAWDGPEWLRHTLPVRLVGSVLGLTAATVGYTYPLVRYLQRQMPANSAHRWAPTLRRMLLAACLSGVALLGTWCSVQWAPAWADKLTQGAEHAKEHTQIVLAIGAIIGTLLAAFMGDWFGRRPAYALLCLLSLASVFVLFQTNTAYGPMLLVSAGLAGAATASFYGWLPLYLPELFPTRIRATGQGFGFNFGRILAAVGALQTGNLMTLFQKDVVIAGMTFTHGYPLACTAMSLIYLVGVGIIWLVPETRGKPLPE
ncbi:MAG TPA: MFS transporter [Gemmataceae bacterium]|nr:MFS transporter [Gemmataceae bacterium]